MPVSCGFLSVSMPCFAFFKLFYQLRCPCTIFFWDLLILNFFLRLVFMLMWMWMHTMFKAKASSNTACAILWRRVRAKHAWQRIVWAASHVSVPPSISCLAIFSCVVSCFFWDLLFCWSLMQQAWAYLITTYSELGNNMLNKMFISLSKVWHPGCVLIKAEALSDTWLSAVDTKYCVLQKSCKFLAPLRKLSATPHFPFDQTRTSFWQRCTVNLGYNNIDIPQGHIVIPINLYPAPNSYIK